MTLYSAESVRAINMKIAEIRSSFSKSAVVSSSGTADATAIRALNESRWIRIHEQCTRWYAMKKIEQQIAEQQSREFHEAEQKKRISRARTLERRKRDEIEYGEEEIA